MRITTLCLACVATLAATGLHAENFKRINSEADFRALVVDRKLTAGKDWMTVKSDGTTVGRIFEQKFNAAWVWQNRMYCRNAVMGKRQLGTDCQVVRIAGKSVEFIREYGKGKSGVMQLP